MAISKLTMQITYAWWAMPYLRAVATFAWLTGMEPDMERVTRTMWRGIKLKAQG